MGGALSPTVDSTRGPRPPGLPVEPAGTEALPPRELRRRCRRALFHAGRRHFAGPRAELRRAAAGFVRRHRRDRRRLLRALRAVTARSGAALLLLGLAQASSAEWIRRDGAANPLPVFDALGIAVPAAVDLDADGDADLVVGDELGGFAYFRNSGGPASPAFVEPPGSGNPLAGFDVGSDSAPALADLDGDGDPDLVSGTAAGAFAYFENTGSAAAPAFRPRFGTANPLHGLDVGAGSAPALVDLDADADLDLVSGDSTGAFAYFENTGGAADPAFAARSGSANPLDGFDADLDSHPAFVDVDGDGDLDAFSGTYGSNLFLENTGTATSPAFRGTQSTDNPFHGLGYGHRRVASFSDLDDDGDPDAVVGACGLGSLVCLFDYRENTGTATSPAFVNRSGPENPLDGFWMGYESAPYLVDLDDDGDLDALSGSASGSFAFFENAGNASSASFVRRTGSQNPLGAHSTPSDSAPAAADLDGDGDLDVFSSSGYGSFRYYENTGSAAAPAFAERTGSANPFGALDVGQFSMPAPADLDADGDVDVVLARTLGFAYFENTGSPTSPAFAERSGSQDPLAGLASGSEFLAPALADFDGDGDLDLVSGRSDGTFSYFENTGSATSPAFAARAGTANPADGLEVPSGLGSTPALADLDGDGDVDLLAGEYEVPGGFAYFENADPPGEHRARRGSENPLDGFEVEGAFGSSGAATPALVDLDGDGDLDVVSGAGDGTFTYLENTGSPAAPAFAERSGSANPLAGLDLGYFSAPAFADVDADGDLDLFSSVAGIFSAEGGFRFFENTGSATAAAFAERTGSANPLDGIDLGRGAMVSFGDVDGDADLDAVVNAVGPVDLPSHGELGPGDGNLAYLENTGSPQSAAFVQRTGSASPLAGLGVGTGGFASLVDLDGDGDLDVLSRIGSYFVLSPLDGTLAYFENTGSASAPAFAPRPGSANPLADLAAGTPTFGDLDGDGDPDLVSGQDGRFAYFENVPPVPLALPGWLGLGAAGGILAALRRLLRRANPGGARGPDDPPPARAPSGRAGRPGRSAARLAGGR